jgi:hypothetical protein
VLLSVNHDHDGRTGSDDGNRSCFPLRIHFGYNHTRRGNGEGNKEMSVPSKAPLGVPSAPVVSRRTHGHRLMSSASCRTSALPFNPVLRCS